MKIRELKNKIVIAELDPNSESICLADPSKVRLDTLRAALKEKRRIPIIVVNDVDKSIKFVEIIKETKEKQDRIKQARLDEAQRGLESIEKLEKEWVEGQTFNGLLEEIQQLRDKFIKRIEELREK